MKRVLIITYYWIPSGGAGVQRWVKFVKYLRDFGWEPVVYAPANPEYPSEDYSFEKDIPPDVEIIKRRIWEPYDIYRNIFGKKGHKINAGFISENKKSDWKDKLAIRIRGNFLIPDPRRFWIRPSVKFLAQYLKEKPVSAVVTTGPPHSMHLIGLGLKNIFPDLAWIADFRDPWTKISYFEDLKLSFPARKYHYYLEKKILENATRVVSVTPTLCKELSEIAGRPVDLIHNGYDEDDVKTGNDIRLDNKFTISHIGTFTTNQNPSVFWKVLNELCVTNQAFSNDLRICLTGKVDFNIIEEIKSAGLSEQLIVTKYLPHSEAIVKQQESQVLLLLLFKDDIMAKGLFTGKFYEYLASGRPVFAIGTTDGDVAKALQETGAGKIAGFQDELAMRTIILDYYERYKSNKLSVSTQYIERFSRKELTKQLSELLNQIC